MAPGAMESFSGLLQIPEHVLKRTFKVSDPGSEKNMIFIPCVEHFSSIFEK